MNQELDCDVCHFCGKKEDPHMVMSCITRLVELHGAAVADIREVELERNDERDRADAAEYDRKLMLEMLRSIIGYEWGKSSTMDTITKHSVLQLIREVEQRAQ